MFNLFKAFASKPKIGVAAIAVINGNKILMGKRRDSGLWTNTGGHIEKGETPVQGAIRELKEESGITASPSQLTGMGFKDVTTIDNKKIRVHAFRLNYKGPTTMLNDPDEEVWRWLWFDLNNMPKTVMENLHARKNILLEKLNAKVSLTKSLDLDVDIFQARYEFLDNDLTKGRSFPVGTIRTYKNGKKYKKNARGEWVEQRDKTEKKDDWHKELKKSDSDIGKIFVDKKGVKYVVDGWDDEHDEWFGRAIDGEGNAHGDEFGFSVKDNLKIHVPPVKKKRKSANDDEVVAPKKKRKSANDDYEIVDIDDSVDDETDFDVDSKILEEEKKLGNENPRETADRIAKENKRNLGVAMTDSIRHVRRQFNSLKEIEESGKASEYVTRENLIKLYPIDVLEGINEDNYKVRLAAYLALKKYPPKPKLSNYASAKKDDDEVFQYKLKNKKTKEIKIIVKSMRKRYNDEWREMESYTASDIDKIEREKYYNSFMDFKKELETEMIQAHDKLIQDHKNDENGSMYGVKMSVFKATKEKNPNYYAESLMDKMKTYNVSTLRGLRKIDVYDNHSNNLLNYVNSITNVYKRRKTTNISFMLSKFDTLADGYRETTKVENGWKTKSHTVIADVLSSEERLEIATQIIEGTSVDKAFGLAGKGKDVKKKFSATDLYAGKAVLNGQKKTGLKTKKQQENFLLDKAGLKSLDFGASITDKEHLQHLEYAANSFNDLTEVLGLPDGMASFNGRLGFAVGSRGRGGKGAGLAHYESSTKIINMTRKNGVGSLAHEWGHFFDNVVKNVTGSSSSWADSSFMSGSYHGKDEKPVSIAFRALSDSDGMREFGEQARNKMREIGMSNSERKYWGAEHEMFARAFEKYVYHKLDKAGKKNTYLCKDVDHGLWPSKDQVEKMTPAFDKIFSEFKNSDLLKKAIAFMDMDLTKEEPYFSNKFWHYPKTDAYSSERKSNWHKDQMENHDSDTVEYKSHESAHKRWKKQDELGKSKFVLKLDLFKAKAKPIGTVTGNWKKISNKDWKYIGHGHQGQVFKVDDDKIVKVSKQTPLIRSDGRKTPEGARKDILEEHQAMEDLKHYSVVPVKHGTWRKGKKVFLVREDLSPLNRDTKLSAKETRKFVEQIWSMYEKDGYVPWDNIEVGRNKKGVAKLIDMGGFKSIKSEKHRSVPMVDYENDVEYHVMKFVSDHAATVNKFSMKKVVGKYSYLSDKALDKKIKLKQGIVDKIKNKTFKADRGNRLKELAETELVAVKDEKLLRSSEAKKIKKPKDQTYTYGMRSRPLQVGAQPEGHISHDPKAKDDHFRHGTVTYKKELTPSQIKSFELIPAPTSEQKLKIANELEKKFDSHDGRVFSDEDNEEDYMEYADDHLAKMPPHLRTNISARKDIMSEVLDRLRAKHLEKSVFSLKLDLFKAGEGSKGGHIVGHTAKGNAIYGSPASKKVGATKYTQENSKRPVKLKTAQDMIDSKKSHVDKKQNNNINHSVEFYPSQARKAIAGFVKKYPKLKDVIANIMGSTKEPMAVMSEIAKILASQDGKLAMQFAKAMSNHDFNLSKHIPKNKSLFKYKPEVRL